MTDVNHNISISVVSYHASAISEFVVYDMTRYTGTLDDLPIACDSTDPINGVLHSTDVRYEKPNPARETLNH